jgi:hypothetical protein
VRAQRARVSSLHINAQGTPGHSGPQALHPLGPGPRLWVPGPERSPGNPGGAPGSLPRSPGRPPWSPRLPREPQESTREPGSAPRSPAGSLLMLFYGSGTTPDAFGSLLDLFQAVLDNIPHKKTMLFPIAKPHFLMSSVFALGSLGYLRPSWAVSGASWDQELPRHLPYDCGCGPVSPH